MIKGYVQIRISCFSDLQKRYVQISGFGSYPDRSRLREAMRSCSLGHGSRQDPDVTKKILSIFSTTGILHCYIPVYKRRSGSMPSGRYTRIEITPEAYMGLEAEAILQRKTLKRLASELILKGISPKALEFVHDAGLAGNPVSEGKISRRVRLSEDKEALEKIKQLWALDPRPSVQEIASLVNYSQTTVRNQIKRMQNSGELPP